MTDSNATQLFNDDQPTSDFFNLSSDNRDIDMLCDAYDDILNRGVSESCEILRFGKKLGAGGQGVVYRSQRVGTDNFILPVALKIFSPIRYNTEKEYLNAMSLMAAVSSRIALIQHDNLLNVNNWSEQQQIRIMEMEFVDGKDLSTIINPRTLQWLKEHCSQKRFESLNNVVLDYGAKNLRFKTGAAVTIISECLKGLGALHREKIVHSDVKPSNIMIKRTGSAKIIDLGSSYLLDNLPQRRSCTPAYAPPEVLDNDEPTVLSDIASLGYVFLELLTGKSLFSRQGTHLQEKRSICYQIEQILGEPLCYNSVLVEFCKKLVAPNPADRFQSADEAVTSDANGAAAILRQLVKMNLASEYSNDLRVLLEDLSEMNHDN
ncbi:MAG: serine/threonine protein kinase [Thermoguttaceae bacterium]|nr:serine/threonine protein kinase [Thermoguttaceae bacterium]